MLAEERPDLLPAIDRRLDPVGGTVDAEECVPGTGEGVEFVRLAELLEGGGQLGRLGGRRELVVSPEQAEQWAGQVLRQPDERLEAGRSTLRHADNRPAVAVHRRVERQAAG